MRIAVGIEYRGTHYYGWQLQEGRPTVQLKLEAAFSRVANCPISVTCAGRTDRGVHALNQVIHFDTVVERSDHAWLRGANAYLPRDIAVHWVKKVPDHFDARRSAIARQYSYFIYNHSIRPALYKNEITWHLKPLEIERMQQAATYFIGEHDFSSFRASTCQAKTAIRRIHGIHLTKKENLIYLHIQANAFLQHMVRNIVGVLFKIGQKEKEPEWILELLKKRDRRAAPATASPKGLYLRNVIYEDKWLLPLKKRHFIDSLFQIDYT